jgi:hypothetical protein
LYFTCKGWNCNKNIQQNARSIRNEIFEVVAHLRKPLEALAHVALEA